MEKKIRLFKRNVVRRDVLIKKTSKRMCRRCEEEKEKCADHSRKD